MVGGAKSEIELVEKELSLVFNTKELLQQALTHSSFVPKVRTLRREDNELLATLGDAVLGLAVADHLFRKLQGAKTFHSSAKGDLTDLRKRFVNNEQLAELARKAHLHLHLHISQGQRQFEINTSMLSTAYEAIIGAIFLDQGYDRAARFIQEKIIESKLISGKT